MNVSEEPQISISILLASTNVVVIKKTYSLFLNQHNTLYNGFQIADFLCNFGTTEVVFQSE